MSLSRPPLVSQKKLQPGPPSPASRRVLGSAYASKSSTVAAVIPATKISSSSSSSSPALRPYTNGRSSPSASELSLTSDLSLGGLNGSGTGGEALVCPICSEVMVTLLQLNRHLDDTHAEVEPIEKDDITTWFRKRMIKAKSFQPVAVLNQKLKGLDVFESNETGEGVGGDGGAVKGGGGGMNGLGATQEERDADFYVTREHWQRTGPEDYCLDPACRKPLGVVNGCVNCRKCGKLFCEEHTMYQIKLSRSALHEPVRGYWSRVCETCYKSREGYNDHNGVITDHTESFIQIRRKKMDRVYLEMTRLEKRLTKLTQTLANPPKLDSALTGGFMKGLSMNLQNQRRSLEQTVVVWENDANVQNCPYCLQTFSLFLQPKHHCRLCGKVVCGDARTACSSEIDLEVTPIADPISVSMTMTPVLAGSAESSDIEKPSTTALSVRICNVCTSSLFSKRDFLHEVHLHPPVVRAYATLISFQSVIREMLPRFQKLADVVQKQRLHTDREVVLEALKMKRKILEALAKVDAQAKRINSLEDGDQGGGGRRTATQERLQCAIAAAAANWGMTIGLRVKSLAAIIDSIASKQRPTAVAEVTKRPGLGRQLSSLSSSGSNLKTSTTTTSLLATNPSTPSLTSPFQLIEQTPIEEEENRLKTQLMVLEEQKFMLGGMLEEAIKHRRLDEVATLRGNMEEIEVEVGKLMVEVGKLGC